MKGESEERFEPPNAKILGGRKLMNRYEVRKVKRWTVGPERQRKRSGYGGAIACKWETESERVYSILCYSQRPRRITRLKFWIFLGIPHSSASPSINRNCCSGFWVSLAFRPFHNSNKCEAIFYFVLLPLEEEDQERGFQDSFVKSPGISPLSTFQIPPPTTRWKNIIFTCCS